MKRMRRFLQTYEEYMDYRDYPEGLKRERLICAMEITKARAAELQAQGIKPDTNNPPRDEYYRVTVRKIAQKD